MNYTTKMLRVETVTPDQAREFLTYNYVHNRPRRPSWVKHLAEEMEAGRFQETAEVHLAYRNGEPTLVNGQHTCAAIVMLNKPVRLTLRKSQTTEPGQIAMIYAFGHDNGIKRTFNDGLGAYNISDEIGLGPTRTQQLATALRHIRNGLMGDNKRSNIGVAPLPEMIEHIYEWSPYAKDFFEDVVATGPQMKNASAKRGSLSVILITYRYQRDKAHEFWDAVLAQTGLISTDPRWQARRVLEDSRERFSGGNNRISPGLLSRQLARCWNKFCNLETMSEKPMPGNSSKSVNESDVIVLLGTPYTGRHPLPPWWPK